MTLFAAVCQRGISGLFILLSRKISFRRHAGLHRKTERSKSAAVVGGQQAGLLTGPLYTIHKIISIIVLARQQEEALQIPVAPIFWVAGEDHDLEEINYVHTSTENKGPVKRKLPQSYWKNIGG